VGYNPSGFAPNATVIRVDIDKEEFARIPERLNWHNFCVSIRELNGVFQNLTKTDMPLDTDNWWEKISVWKNSYPIPKEITQEFSDGISSYQVISQASVAFEGKNIVTGSSGTCMEMLLQSWQVQDGQRIINSCGIGSMGFAVPAAIGVSVKTGNGEVICIESDGSFAMNLQDLVTMKETNSLFKVIVMDSSGYKSISLSQGRLNQYAHGNSFETQLRLPDIHKVAESIGFQTKTVDKAENLPAAISWLKDATSSSILILKVSEREDALPRLISRPNALGVMETPPMNELTPFV
jgi:acetolactate synthase-1/2/3 large subunit